MKVDPNAVEAVTPEALDWLAGQEASRRHMVPIKWWAGLGAGFLALWVYLWTRWIAGPSFKAVPTGATPVPEFMKVGAVTFTIVGFLAAGITVFYIVVRPWRREGKPTFDALMLLAFMTMLWQDDAANFYRPLITYNSWMTNLGSWYRYIPGWISPGGNKIAEPVLWDWPLYVYFWLPACLLGCLVMRKAGGRWPNLGRLGQATVAFATFAVLDLLLEVGFWTRLGLYTYPGASGWLTIFRGHYYQFPLYETIVLAAMWTVLSSVRQFRNAHGETIVERGARKLQGGQRKRTLITFLALVGICNATFLAYNVTVATIGMYQSGWPHDSQKRSYLVDGQCGAGTPYACPTPNLPKGRSGTH